MVIKEHAVVSAIVLVVGITTGVAVTHYFGLQHKGAICDHSDRSVYPEVSTGIERLENQINELNKNVETMNGTIAAIRRPDPSVQTSFQLIPNEKEEMPEQRGYQHSNHYRTAGQADNQESQAGTLYEDARDQILNAIYASNLDLDALVRSEFMQTLSPDDRDRVMSAVIAKLNTGEIDAAVFLPGFNE